MGKNKDRRGSNRDAGGKTQTGRKTRRGDHSVAAWRRQRKGDDIGSSIPAISRTVPPPERNDDDDGKD